MANEFALLDGPLLVSETAISNFEAGVAGYNPNVGGNNVPQDIWPVGGLYTFLAASAAGTIVSTSANDDNAAGTGARSVLIQGLDNSFNPIGETVLLSGLTPVALANSYRRINFANVITAGSTETNEGDIDITVGGSILARLPIAVGTNRAAIYTVPATFPVMDFVRAWGNPGKQAASNLTLELFLRDNAASPGPVIRNLLTLEFNTQGESWIEQITPTRNDVEPGSDVWMRCTQASTNANSFGAGFDIINVP